MDVVSAGVAETSEINFVRREGVFLRSAAAPAQLQGTNASRLATVSFTVNTMFAVAYDTRAALTIPLGGRLLGAEDVSGWGYLLTTSEITATQEPQAAPVGGVASNFFPRESGVVVSVAMPVDRFYRRTTVSVTVGAFQLVSNILSVFGAVGALGFFFQLLRRCGKNMQSCLCPEKPITRVLHLRERPPPPAPLRGTREGWRWSRENPFFRREEGPAPPSEVVHAPPPERRLFKVRAGEQIGAPVGGVTLPRTLRPSDGHT